MKPDSPVLAAAISYVKKYGWKVFPARMEHGRKYSWLSAKYAPGHENWGMSNDADQVQWNFSKPRWRDRCGIGIPTGAVNGIFVIDVDTIAGHGVDGIGALRKLEREHGRLPKTLKAKTPSHGIHFYFRHPGNGIKIMSRAIAPGVDCKGDGGQVAAPPSKNSSGGRYRWIDRRRIAKAPQWLLDLVTKPARAPRVAIADDELPARETIILGLALLPNDNDDYNVWKETGMMIYASTAGTGFDLFDAWSRKWHGYNAVNTRIAWDKQIAECPPDRYGPRAIINLFDRVMPEWQYATMTTTYDAQIKKFLELLDEKERKQR